MVGTTISHYKVLEKIGQGGMGEVYLAQDTTLDRKVALKFLPEELQQDSTAKGRFLREAKSAAALDHPFICKIYEVGEAEEKSFISMEYVQGETLKEKLEEGPLPLKEALEKATEVAEALGEAHKQGIVHRDVKPANIMLTPQGHVKMMDFGLAKQVTLVEGQEQEITTALTKQGSTLGTVPYMSPEQVRGQVVDTRSDIFSFGVVLYEMLAGVHPFKKGGQIETANAILSETAAPLTRYADDIPVLLQHTVKKMLAKEADRRYQLIHDVRINLEELIGDIAEVLAEPATLSPIGVTTAVRPALWRRAIPLVLASLVVAAIIASIAVWNSMRQSPRGGPPQLLNPVQLTFGSGSENYPTWSPDAGRVAYESAQSGNLDIWVTQLNGEPVNRTADHEGPDRYPSWSPDGQQIAFISRRNEEWGLYAMSAVGGSARKAASLPSDTYETSYISGIPQWSADSTEIAVSAREAGQNVAVMVSLQSRETRQIPLPQHEGYRCFELSWSPDARFFAYVTAFHSVAQNTQLWVMPSSGGEPTPVTDGRTNDWNPLWSSDSRRLFFVSNRGGAMDLWQQRIGDNGTLEGPPEAMTTGLGITKAAFSSDGTRFAYSRAQRVSNLWRIPILGDRLATWADAEQLIDGSSSIDVSFDGRIIFDSRRGGSPDLWTLPRGGGEMTRVTMDRVNEASARWSPDGTQIAFGSNLDIWVMPSTGGPKRQMTFHPAEDSAPTWSPDGQEIAFVSTRAGNRDVWVMGTEVGEPRQITSHPGIEYFPDWSPDGRWIVFHSWRSGNLRLWRIPAAGGQAEMVSEGPGIHARWSPSGNLVYFVGWDERTDLWALSLEDGREYRVTDLVGRRGRPGWFLATDDQYLYFPWWEELGDIWVMDVVQDDSP